MPNEEYVSYDLKSQFTNVPSQEEIYYILDEIYVKSKLPKLCSKLIFKRLLLKLTTENDFIFTSNFYKQTPFLLYFHIYMSKMELQVVKPSKILQTPRE